MIEHMMKGHSMPVNSPKKTPKKSNLKTAWKPGQSGNPKGRPPGSRNKLSEQVLAALCEDFEEHGASVLVEVRKKDPASYLRVAASLIPKQSEIKLKSDLDHLTDEQLQNRIDTLAIKTGYSRDA